MNKGGNVHCMHWPGASTPKIFCAIDMSIMSMQMLERSAGQQRVQHLAASCAQMDAFKCKATSRGRWAGSPGCISVCLQDHLPHALHMGCLHSSHTPQPAHDICHVLACPSCMHTLYCVSKTRKDVIFAGRGCWTMLLKTHGQEDIAVGMAFKSMPEVFILLQCICIASA